MVSTTNFLVVCAATIGAAQRSTSFPRPQYGLAPRHMPDWSFPLAKRQDACPQDQHSCQEFGFGECCSNDEYCYISTDDRLLCCDLDSDCVSNNPCTGDGFRCFRTRTVSSGTVTTEPTCCTRPCATNFFQCAQDLGGECCPLGFECRAGGSCVHPRSATSSSTVDLTPVPEGCTTAQCDGGQGCCNNSQHCTQISGTDYCVSGSPTNTDIVIEENNSSSGLSDGATAGIAVGSVVGAGLIIGAITWLFILRKRRRDRQHSGRTVTLDTITAPRPGDDGTMTEVTAPSARARRNRAGTHDYFGPDPAVGPFTETEFSSPAASPGMERGVPSQPHTPGDIVSPVEIDSQPMPAGDRSPSISVYETPGTGNIDGRIELGETETAPPRRSDSVQRTP